MIIPIVLWSVLLATSSPATPDEFVDIPGGAFRSTVRYEDNGGNFDIVAFSIMERAVSHRQFQDFVRRHPQWNRERVATVFADSGYLAQWRDARELADSLDPDSPVTHVSWFAADAYCKAQGARLPDWPEWEYVAAANTRLRDAREDLVWRKRVFNDGTPRAVDAAVDAAPNAYGVSGMHGANWEWVGDYATLLGNADKRGQGGDDRLQFCGATGLSFNNRDDYAVLKRVALLSAMQPRSTLGNLGFRCARSTP